ncbi:MAG TPA: PIN domain-containing protein [Acidimicrobiales bacterium]|nr:PIN domain-containing protein [Acidimicrobiales bacterium]
MGAPVRAVLDTSVVIATDVGRLDGELAVSAVTVAELHFGVLVARDGVARAERLRRLTVLQRKFDALAVDDSVAAAYGELAAAAVEAGRSPRPRSLALLIAATARVHDARLYTRNIEDFVGTQDLVEVVAV